MSLIMTAIDLILHLEDHLLWIIDKFGAWSYAILFAIIFLETGMVFTPFLPGDSLVFTVGAIAALGGFNVAIMLVLLIVAAILGDSVNYAIGHYLGPKIIKRGWLRKEHLDRTHKFFEKHGNKTIVLARFVPIVRTFAPFLAGIGAMTYSKFLLYNVIGGIVWIALFLFSGFFFGNIPFVRDNFAFVIIGIIIVSFVPLVWEYVKHRREMRGK